MMPRYSGMCRLPRMMATLLRLSPLAIAALSMPAHATWLEAKSKHFVIYANEGQGELRDYADRLERFDQAVRYFRHMDDPALTDAGKVTIFVLPDSEAVERLTGMEMVRGMYTTHGSGSFAFVPYRAEVIVQGMSKGTGIYHEDLNPQQIFFHEYAHHLQLQNAEVALPTWVSEGFAEFLATADVRKDGSVIFGKFPTYRAGSVQDRNSLPLEQMVGETYGKSLTGWQVSALYARGWLLTHYLAMTDSRKGQLTDYINRIQTGSTPLAAAKAAFGDIRQLDQDLQAYMGARQLTGFTVDGHVISPGEVTLRPLTPGEIAAMPVRMRSKLGVTEATAPGVASDARRIAAAFPSDPDVQLALAEAELDAKNYAAADAAAGRVLAARPNDVHGMIFKGRAQMAEARANPKSANWSSIRGWFLKANKIDTENAEPLRYYFESFVAAGANPPADASEGLLYAVELAPRDDEIRMEAVDLLLAQNKLPEARQMISPVVYEPHQGDERRKLATQVLGAIDAGDAKKAKQILEQPSAKTTRSSGS